MGATKSRKFTATDLRERLAANPSLRAENAGLEDALGGPTPQRGGPQRSSEAETGTSTPQKASGRKMNRTEAEFMAFLKRTHPLGTRVLYEGYTLKLADDCRYTPDFATVTPTSTSFTVDFYEVKNARHIFSRSLNKPKAAATIFPQHDFFLAVRQTDGTWEINKLKPA